MASGDSAVGNRYGLDNDPEGYLNNICRGWQSIFERSLSKRSCNRRLRAEIETFLQKEAVFWTGEMGQSPVAVELGKVLQTATKIFLEPMSLLHSLRPNMFMMDYCTSLIQRCLGGISIIFVVHTIFLYQAVHKGTFDATKGAYSDWETHITPLLLSFEIFTPVVLFLVVNDWVRIYYSTRRAMAEWRKVSLDTITKSSKESLGYLINALQAKRQILDQAQG